MTRPVISVIIPTLNEAPNLVATCNAIQSAARLPRGYSVPYEIIIVDGGSTDATVELATECADRVFSTEKGRAKQMNAGANLASGELLIFVHADTHLQPGSLVHLARIMANSDILGGGFTKDWLWTPPFQLSTFLKFSAWFWQGVGNWLVVLFHQFPGDNALFVRKSIFSQLRGFKNYWICEDLDFSYRLHGLVKHLRLSRNSIRFIPLPVLTSARRFTEYGFFRVWLWWITIFFLWRLGWSQSALAAYSSKFLQSTRWLFQKRGNYLLL